MAVIVPDPDDFQDTLRLVLELSDRPRDVRIVDIPAIEVPDEVAERLERYQDLDSESQDAEQAPVKRKPGRPRKNPLPEEQA